MNFHYLFLLIGLLTIAGTLISLRREHIRTEYSISWLAVGVIMTGLAAFPRLLDEAAHWMSVGPETCFLIASGTLVLVLVYEVSLVVSRLRDENVILAQRVAILEFQILERKNTHGGQEA